MGLYTEFVIFVFTVAKEGNRKVLPGYVGEKTDS